MSDPIEFTYHLNQQAMGSPHTLSAMRDGVPVGFIEWSPRTWSSAQRQAEARTALGQLHFLGFPVGSSSWGGVALDEARKGIALLGNDDDKKARLHEGLLTLARG